MLPAAAALVVPAAQLPWPALSVTTRDPGIKDPGIVSELETTYDPRPGTRAYNDYVEVDIVIEVTSGRDHVLNLALQQINTGAMTPTDATGPARSLGNQGLGQLGADTFLVVPERTSGVNLDSYRETFSEGLVLCAIIVWARPGAVNAATAHRVALLEDALIKATPGTSF
jgi:hypothetical protein